MIIIIIIDLVLRIIFETCASIYINEIIHSPQIHCGRYE